MTDFTNFPPIHDTLGDKINDLPVLDVGNKNGSTDYIDYINAKDMSAPIMRGVDRFGRPFLAIKVSIGDKSVVGTFFQRYSDCKVNWAYGSTCCNALWDSSRFANLPEDYNNLTERLRLLFNGENVKTYNYDLSTFDKVVGNGKDMCIKF